MSLPSDPIFYFVGALAIILVGLAKGGFSGLGNAAMPLLTLVMDPIQAAAMLLPILLVQDAVGVWAFRKSYDLPTLKLTLPGAALGIFLGWYFATIVSVDVIRAMVGLIAIIFAAQRLLGLARASAKPLPSFLGFFWGGVSGFTSQVALAGGPPFQVWALSRNFPHPVFIGTSAIFFMLINILKLPAFWALGQFTWPNMQLTLVFLPLAVLSTFAGVWMVKRIAPERFHLAINLLLIAVGSHLLWQALT